jgi:hypothetical protein
LFSFILTVFQLEIYEQYLRPREIIHFFYFYFLIIISRPFLYMTRYSINVSI